MDRAWALRLAVLVAVVVAVGLVGRSVRPATTPPRPAPAPASPPPAPLPAPSPPVTITATVTAPAGVTVAFVCPGLRGQARPGADGGFTVEAAGACEVRLERAIAGVVLNGPWEPLRDGARYQPPRLEGLGVLAEADGELLRVVAVEAGGPADRAGVAVGDRLVSVGGTPAAELGPEDLEALEPPLDAEVRRGGQTRHVAVR